MKVSEQRRELFVNVERLRRAQRSCPKDEDIATVRAWLEDELGPTVSIRLAARLLGITHSSLTRWIDGGDIPTVITPAGRREIPVDVLFDLREAVGAERDNGRTHVLEPIMRRARERAEQLEPRRLVADVETGGHGHRGAELRALAYHRAIASRLRASEVAEARHVIARWRRRGTIHPDYARAWEELLDRPIDEIRRIITTDSELARDLRQNSPLAGMLSEPERRRIIDELA